MLEIVTGPSEFLKAGGVVRITKKKRKVVSGDRKKGEVKRKILFRESSLARD